MCRFVAYLGSPIRIDEVIIKPSNSLIQQSYHALESTMTVNGDGFGLGWYDKEIQKDPRPVKLIECFKKTFSEIEKLKKSKGLNSVSNYNIVLSNGRAMVATRFSSMPEIDNRTLYFAENVSCKLNTEGDLKFEKGKLERSAALISSEKLTEDEVYWKEIPFNHAVYIEEDMEVSLFPLNL